MKIADFTSGCGMTEPEPDYQANTEALDAAIRQFLAENCKRTGVLTGWILLSSHSRYNDNGQMFWSYDYNCGPDTDLIRAAGIMELCRDMMKGHILRQPDNE